MNEREANLDRETTKKSVHQDILQIFIFGTHFYDTGQGVNNRKKKKKFQAGNSSKQLTNRK